MTQCLNNHNQLMSKMAPDIQVIHFNLKAATNVMPFLKFMLPLVGDSPFHVSNCTHIVIYFMGHFFFLQN